MIRARRLTTADRAIARRLFAMMAEVFEEEHAPLGDAYLDRLLTRDDLWVIAALADGDEPVGGLTAHTLPMTRAEVAELFIYDVAVRADRQRQGVGRLLVTTLRESAPGCEVFVPADDEDLHALAFYRALGGEGAPVTVFTFRPRAR